MSRMRTAKDPLELFKSTRSFTIARRLTLVDLLSPGVVLSTAHSDSPRWARRHRQFRPRTRTWPNRTQRDRTGGRVEKLTPYNTSSFGLKFFNFETSCMIVTHRI